MFGAVFQIDGVVAEKRELTSQKNSTWRGYILKTATLGATFELTATADQFNQCLQGDQRRFKGMIEDNQGRARFVITEIGTIPVPKTGDKASSAA